MRISGHETRTLLERYNIVSLKTLWLPEPRSTRGAASRPASAPIPAEGPADRPQDEPFDICYPPHSTCRAITCDRRWNPDVLLVRTGRVELPWPFGRQILSRIYTVARDGVEGETTTPVGYHSLVQGEEGWAGHLLGLTLEYPLDEDPHSV